MVNSLFQPKSLSVHTRGLAKCLTGEDPLVVLQDLFSAAARTGLVSAEPQHCIQLRRRQTLPVLLVRHEDAPPVAKRA